MRDRQDPGSIEMFPGTKRPRGRPRVENPVSPAERMRAYRERLRTGSRSVDLAKEAVIADLAKEVRRLKRQLRDAAGPKKRNVTKKGK